MVTASITSQNIQHGLCRTLLLHAFNSSDLRDDEHHYATDALCAAALADTVGAGIGSLLSREVRRQQALQAVLIRQCRSGRLAADLDRACQSKRGRERKWVKEGTACDEQVAQALYRRVAERAFAHWLDGHCPACSGSGNTKDHRSCVPRKGAIRS